MLCFGAKGNGTQNDQPFIQKAIQYCARMGLTLYFPEGTYHCKTVGVPGMLIEQSNLEIEFHHNAWLVMDNMVNGNATSHGVFVKGPCENIVLNGVKCRYIQMSATRSGSYAPFYFLGANVGEGNQNTGGWYRGEPGGENVELIRAGSVRNISVLDCVSQNSPSVGIGIINVDGIILSNFKASVTWADGVYMRCMRRGRINNVEMDMIGDDAVSIGTEESNLVLADINHEFHCEGTVVNNVTVRYNYPLDSGHAGSVVILGCRDVVVSNFVAWDRFRIIKIECGTETTGRYDRLNLNFLASKNVIINGVTGHNSYQAIWFLQKEFNGVGVTDPKWWHYENLLVTNIRIYGCFVGVSSSGISGGQPNPQTPPPEGPSVVAGVTIDDVKCHGVTSIFSNLDQLYDTEILNLYLDNQLTLGGACPFRGNIDNPRYPANNSIFDNIEASRIVFRGLKNCLIGRATSRNSPSTGVSITTCADIHFDILEGINANRDEGQFSNNVSIDLYCRRITGAHVWAEQDDVFIPDLFSINNHEDHWVETVTVKSNLDQFDRKVSDAGLNQLQQPQIGRINWIQTEYPQKEWRHKDWKKFGVSNNGDTNLIYFPNGDNTSLRYTFPLTVNRTVELSHDAVANGDPFTFQRTRSAPGPVSISFSGRKNPASVGNILVNNISASGEFTNSGSENITFGGIEISANLVNNSAGTILAPYLKAYTVVVDSDEDFSDVTFTSPPVADILSGASANLVYTVPVQIKRSSGGSITSSTDVFLPNGTYRVEILDSSDQVLSTAVIVISAIGTLQKIPSGSDNIITEPDRQISPTFYLGSLPITYPIYTTGVAQIGTWDFVFNADSDRWEFVRASVEDIVPISQDYGDSDAALTAILSPAVAYFGTTLTQNRSITLSTSGAINGDTFRIFRTAGGAFNLDVGSLKMLAADQWVDVTYNGTQWVVTAFGDL